MRIAALSLAFVSALTACAPQSEGVTLVRSVSPGETIPSRVTAVTLFKSVCVDTRASHPAMQARLETLPVTFDPTSEIWYHDEYDLSFKAIESRQDVCSFVSAVRESGTAAAVADTARAAGMIVRSFDTTYEDEPSYITVQTYDGR